mmetsp:Transcript_21413/g.44593  ORF Transcript_21413/g.44593 Transcript_21413/m.44593 type:complete len:225 (-) Transcript_21413:2065-2739(-)
MAEHFCLTMTPLLVVTRISSSSLTSVRQLMESISSPSTGSLNFIAITPMPPLPCDLNSVMGILFPYPFLVTARTYPPPSTSPPSPSIMLISATPSPGRNFMLLTPLEVLAVGRRRDAEYLVAIPFLDPKKTSISSVHFDIHFRESPSSREAIMSPLEVRFSKAASGVFFIHPLSVARTINSSLVNLGTGSTEATVSSAVTGRTDGSGTPLAVLPATGIWKARSP